MSLTIRTEIKITKKDENNYNTDNKVRNFVNKYKSMVKNNQTSIVYELSTNYMNTTQRLGTKKCLHYKTPIASLGNNLISCNKKKKKRNDVDHENEYGEKIILKFCMNQ